MDWEDSTTDDVDERIDRIVQRMTWISGLGVTYS